MSIYETIGVVWCVFAVVLATVEVLYLAFIGLQEVLLRQNRVGENLSVEQIAERIVEGDRLFGRKDRR